MYLKRLELCGFKSFTGKTKIDFQPGVSCIVGPNGSGKSNIADALRWVLGESNARSIRGGRMEDVIFSGTKKRRPLGMAEVSVVLDNTDNYLPLAFAEICVTRRAVRNGASEYYINQQPCRLKDIHDLFVDTGIGVEGLSLINQGRIHELISARPDERRSLVEEAAGIVKYRDRKQEAVRKLAETERHLQRIGDIIAELSARVEPLRQQADKARQFLDYKNEADNLEIGISVKVLTEADEKLAALDQQLRQGEEALLAEESARLAAAAQAEQLRLTLAAMDEQVAAANEEHFRLQTDREREEGQLKLVQSRLDNNRDLRERFTRELAVNRQLADHKQQEQCRLQEEIALSQQELAEQEGLIASGEGGGEGLLAHVAELNRQLGLARDRAARLGAELAKAVQSSEFKSEQALKAGAALAQLETEEEQLAADEQQLISALAQLGQKQRQLQGQSQALSAQMNENELKVRQLSGRAQDLAAEEADCRFRCHSLQTRVNLLNEMAAGYEGFFPGVKGLLSAWRQGKAPEGVLGVIAELMETPEPLRVAVEAYLGANIQNIVCQDAAAARAAVDYLKQHKLGRATFLPLDILKVRPAPDFSQVQGRPGVCGRASELIRVEAPLQPALDFLLNSVLIVEDMDAALAAAKTLNYRCSVVTLEGDMINPGASISGGSKGGKAGELLAKKARMDEAAAQLAAVEKELEQQTAALNQARQASEQANAAGEALREQLRQISQALQALAQESSQHSLRQENISQRQAVISRERGRLSGELNYLEAAAGESAQDAELLRAEDKQLQAALLADETSLQAAEELLAASRQDMTDKRVSLAAGREKLTAQQANLDKLAQELENLSWEAEDKAQTLSQLEEEAQGLSSQLQAAEQRLRDIAAAMLSSGDILEQARHGLAAESGRLGELDKQERAHGQAQERLRNDMHQLQLRRERWQADFENEAAKLAERFELELDAARERVGETPARTVMLTRLNVLRKDIAALGVVNIGAIEEYREVSERYAFLTGQRDDMVEAAAKLNGVISEMDNIMAGRFTTAFHQLSEAFNASFTRLFGGGSASLYLSQPEDILSTGVELRVDPPGKKVSNYNLLSGGEKSLIGIALMFAMLEVRPTPFCMMDEVDAALDEANIDRFTAYLQDRANNSQFVMISHRQSTMEAASALWGVTMEEEGVSKVLSVRLTEIAG